jgi:dUTP pyrophosphatase
MSLIVRVRKLHPQAQLPKFSHLGSRGDLAADLFCVDHVILTPNDVRPVSTGLALQLPEGFGALVHDRSGLAVSGVTTLGGVIDSGYRGEIRVIMANVGREAVEIRAGDRICQMRLVQLLQAEFIETDELADTERGSGGFGSTGR